MKNKRFWIFVIIGFVIIGLVVLIVCLVPENEATWVIAAFTVVLAVTTILNGIITQGLLRQSRQAFEMDTFNKMVSSTSQLNVELRSLKWSSKKRAPYVENFAAGMLITLRNSDPIMFQEISKAIDIWVKTDKGFPAITYLNALNKVKEYQKIEKKELNKCEK